MGRVEIFSRKARKERKDVAFAAQPPSKSIVAENAAVEGLGKPAALKTSLRSLWALRETTFTSFLRASAPPREQIRGAA